MTERAAPIVLVGGGHAHVAVLADWARRGLPCERAVLVTPEPFLRYSGMVPGWISGQYSHSEACVDLAGLARAAGAELVLDRCVAIDPAARSILTMQSGVLSFEYASIDTGGAGQAAKVLGSDPRLIDVRPIGSFVEQTARVLAQRSEDPLKIAVIGGGAAGFELAFALNSAKELANPPQVKLVTGRSGVLPGFSNAARRAVLKEFAAQEMQIAHGDADLSSGALSVDGRLHEPVDVLIAAIGSGAPDWPRAGGLAVDEDGFIAVDAWQRSASHPHVFAAGDIAARMDCTVPHSGVHAVHTGPVLTANLRSVLAGKAPRRIYRPRPANLYLLSTGRGEAIAAYGPLAAKGRWLARLKAWIDKRWIARYAAISNAGL